MLTVSRHCNTTCARQNIDLQLSCHWPVCKSCYHCKSVSLHDLCQPGCFRDTVDSRRIESVCRSVSCAGCARCTARAANRSYQQLHAYRQSRSVQCPETCTESRVDNWNFKCRWSVCQACTRCNGAFPTYNQWVVLVIAILLCLSSWCALTPRIVLLCRDV